MGHCLLVDDSRLARRICRAMLEELGYRVTEAEDGEAALQLLDRYHFDAALVDQNMPHMLGTAFISRARALPSGADVPMMLCSSDADIHMVRHALRHGANAYFNKPYTAATLARRLARLRAA